MEYNVILNDSTNIALFALPWETVVTRRGKDIRVICIPCNSEMTVEEVKATFGDIFNTTKMTFTENGNTVNTYSDYIKIQEITWVAEDPVEDTEEDVAAENASTGHYIVKLSQAVTYDNEILALKTELSTANEKLAAVSASVTETQEAVVTLDSALAKTTQALSEVQGELEPVDPDTLDLPELKTYLTNTSKMNLANYLEANPITSSVHGGVEKSYAITSEKQQHLMAMILMAKNAEEMRNTSMKSYYDATYTTEDSITYEEFVAGYDDGSIVVEGTAFPKYQPSWNASGEPCTYDWTIEELVTLAAQIESVVRPLISKQQEMEVSINAATTTDEAKAVTITF